MFKNDAAEFVYYRTYSRWVDELGRRETWEETVERVVNFLKKHRGDKVPKKVFQKIKEGMLKFDLMPSMRLVWAAGEAAEQDNTTLYNCSFINVDCIEAFSEALYILMCGTGVGFSVEKKNIEKLPIVPALLQNMTFTVTISDDKKGWADSVYTMINNMYQGINTEFDYSLLRPKGARLRVMGGRSSGPEPLILLHGFIREVFSKAQGRKLTSLECHDIMNQIAEIVVVGGVRRSSQISLSDLDDNEMRHAKDWPMPPRRWMANNSAVYLTKPTAVQFLKEWAALAASGTGERGIFNLEVAQKNAPKRRKGELIAGTNPCAEISLMPSEFCNLSSVIIRSDDDLDSLLEKVETATWIGIIQSTFTHFPYLRHEWRVNCEEERLLGVSLSGQMDNSSLLTAECLKALKSRATKTAQRAAKALEVNVPAAITCVKPEGTSSQVVASGSGLHVWYSPHFIRRYRISDHDPLCKMLKAQGFPMKPENGQTEETANTWVVSFPGKAPENAITKDMVNAIDQLEWYKKVQMSWCEHNASCTIYVKEDEWFEVGNWVYKNWNIVNGLSFLPYDGGKYEQAPLEEISKEQYDKLVAKFQKIDYNMLSQFEKEDGTDGAKTYACVGNQCEI